MFKPENRSSIEKSNDNNEQSIDSKTVTYSKQQLTDELVRTRDLINNYDNQVENEHLWPVNVMKLILGMKYKQEGAQTKPLHTHYLVYQSDVKNDTECQTEVIALAEFLKNNINKLPNGLRFQLVVHQVDHWTIIENEIVDGKLNIFMLDAGLSAYGDIALSAYVNCLKHNDIKSNIYIYGIEQSLKTIANSLMEETAEYKAKKRTQAIQVDRFSCGVFVATQAPAVAKSTVFDHLRQRFGEQIFKKIKKEDLPSTLAKIFKLAQSRTFVNSLSTQQKSAVIDKQGRTLKMLYDHSKQSADKNFFRNRPKEKGLKIINKTLHFVSDNNDKTLNEYLKNNLLAELQEYAENHSPEINTAIAFSLKKIATLNLSDVEKLKIHQMLHQLILNNKHENHDLIMFTLTTLNLLNTYPDVEKIIAAICAHNIFQITDNNILLQLYHKVSETDYFQQVKQASKLQMFLSNESKPWQLHFEKALKAQLLTNAMRDPSQLQVINSNEALLFLIDKPSVFNVSTTQSRKLLNSLNDYSKSEIPQDIKANILNEKAAICLDFQIEFDEGMQQALDGNYDLQL